MSMRTLNKLLFTISMYLVVVFTVYHLPVIISNVYVCFALAFIIGGGAGWIVSKVLNND